MKIKLMKLADIQPAFYNPRKDLKPGDPEYEKIKTSIKEFDCVEPLVWNKRTQRLVGGHQRLKILKAEGVVAFEVSVVDLDEKKERALNLALNKAQGDWDFTKLANILGELDDGEFDMNLTAFDTDELEEIATWTSKDPTEKEIEYFKKIHVLISMPLDKFIEISDLIEQIKNNQNVEYEQSAN